MVTGNFIAYLPDKIFGDWYYSVKERLFNLGKECRDNVPIFGNKVCKKVERIRIAASVEQLREIDLFWKIGMVVFVVGLVLFFIAFITCCRNQILGMCSCRRLTRYKVYLVFLVNAPQIILSLIVAVEVAFFAMMILRESPLHDKIKSYSMFLCLCVCIYVQ